MSNITTLSTAFLEFIDTPTATNFPTASEHDYRYGIKFPFFSGGAYCVALEVNENKVIDGVTKHNVITYAVWYTDTIDSVVVYTQEDGWISNDFRSIHYPCYANQANDLDPELAEWFSENTHLIQQTGEPEAIKFYSDEPFTISTPNNTPTWYTSPNENGMCVEGDTEGVWDGSTVVSSVFQDNKYVISLYFRISNGSSYSRHNNSYVNGLVLTGNNIHVSGKISSLILSVAAVHFNEYDSTTYSQPISTNTFKELFLNNTSIVDASELVCDVVRVNTYTYMSTFEGCSNLRYPPQLPVTTLSGACYGYMFRYCTGLEVAPVLPAMSINGGSCYAGMFYGCTSLTRAPLLLATQLSSGCYQTMFQGCSSLIEATDLPATTLPQNCYYHMFENCSSLISAPKILATTISGKTCCRAMFKGCTGLKTLPDLLTMSSTQQTIYREMFSGCTNIKLSATQVGNYTKPFRIPKNGSGSFTGTSALTDMFVDTGGTFSGTPNANRVYYLYEDEIHTTPFDLSSLELQTGTHTIQVKARAQGHEDSEFSNSVSYYATTPIIH